MPHKFSRTPSELFKDFERRTGGDPFKGFGTPPSRFPQAEVAQRFDEFIERGGAEEAFRPPEPFTFPQPTQDLVGRIPGFQARLSLSDARRLEREGRLRDPNTGQLLFPVPSEFLRELGRPGAFTALDAAVRGGLDFSVADIPIAVIGTTPGGSFTERTTLGEATTTVQRTLDFPAEIGQTGFEELTRGISQAAQFIPGAAAVPELTEDEQISRTAIANLITGGGEGREAAASALIDRFQRRPIGEQLQAGIVFDLLNAGIALRIAQRLTRVLSSATRAGDRLAVLKALEGIREAAPGTGRRSGFRGGGGQSELIIGAQTRTGDVIAGIIRQQASEASFPPGSINSVSLPAISELTDVMRVIASGTTDDPVTRGLIGKTGINPSVLKTAKIEQAILGNARQRIEARDLTEIALQSKVDVHAGRVSGSLPRAIGMNPKGVIEGTGKNWYDVIEQELNNAGTFKNLTEPMQNLIADIGDLLTDMNAVRVWYGLNSMGAEDVFILPRQIESIADIAVTSKQRPELGRIFEEATEGIERGVVYSTNPRESLRVYISGSYNEIIDRQLADILDPLSLKPTELIPANVYNDLVNSYTDLAAVRNRIREERQQVIRARTRAKTEVQQLRDKLKTLARQEQVLTVRIEGQQISKAELSRAKGIQKVRNSLESALRKANAELAQTGERLAKAETELTTLGRGEVSFGSVAERPYHQLTFTQFKTRVKSLRRARIRGDLSDEALRGLYNLSVERAAFAGLPIPNNVLASFPELETTLQEASRKLIPTPREVSVERLRDTNARAQADLRQIEADANELDIRLLPRKALTLEEAENLGIGTTKARLDRLAELQRQFGQGVKDLNEASAKLKDLRIIRTARGTGKPISEALEQELSNAHTVIRQKKAVYSNELTALKPERKSGERIANVIKDKARLKTNADNMRGLAMEAEAKGNVEAARKLRIRADVVEGFGTGLFNEQDSIALAVWKNRMMPQEQVKLLEENAAQFGNRNQHFFMQFINTQRTLRSVGDFAAPFIQGPTVFFTNPKAWGIATAQHYRAWVDPQVQARYIRDNLDSIQRMVKTGVGPGDAEFFAATRAGQGLSPGAVLELIPKVGTEVRDIAQFVGRQSFGRFQASYNTFLLMARHELWKSMEAGSLFKGQADELGSYINNLTGGLNSSRLGLSPSRQASEGLWMAFAPRLFRSTVTLSVDSIKTIVNTGRIPFGAKPSARQIASFRTLAWMLSGSAAIYAVTGLAMGRSWKEIADGLNPLSGKRFMSFQIHGQWIGIGGQVRSLVQLASNIGTAMVPGKGKDFNDLITTDMNDNILAQFASSRAAPAVQIARTGFEGLTQGEIDATPFDEIDSPVDAVVHIGEDSLPFALQGGLEGDKSFGILAGFVGLRTSPATPGDERRTLRMQRYQKLLSDGDIPEITDNGESMTFDRAMENSVHASLIDRDERITEKSEEIREKGLERRDDVAEYLQERDDENKEKDVLISELATKFGISAEFRHNLREIQRLRFEALKDVDGRNEDSIEVLDGLDDRESKFDADRRRYFDAFADIEFVDPLTGDFDGDRFEGLKEQLIEIYGGEQRGEDRFNEIRDFNRSESRDGLTEEAALLLKRLDASRDLIGESGYWSVNADAAETFATVDPVFEDLFKQYSEMPTRVERENFAKDHVEIRLIQQSGKKRKEAILLANSTVERHLRAWGYLGIGDRGVNSEVTAQLRLLRVLQGGNITDVSALLDMDLDQTLEQLQAVGVPR